MCSGLRVHLGAACLHACAREFVRECESVCLSVVVHALITRLRELCAGECALPWAVPECPHVKQCCGFFNSLHPGQARRHTLDHKAQGNTYRAIKIRSNVASCLFIEVKHNTFHARASDCRRVRPDCLRDRTSFCGRVQN